MAVFRHWPIFIFILFYFLFYSYFPILWSLFPTLFIVFDFFQSFSMCNLNMYFYFLSFFIISFINSFKYKTSSNKVYNKVQSKALIIITLHLNKCKGLPIVLQVTS